VSISCATEFNFFKSLPTKASRLVLPLPKKNGRFSQLRDQNQPIRIREEFRALLGVRKYPKNESSVLWAGAMGISAEGLFWWGLLKRGLAGLGPTFGWRVPSVSF
jgi:hypothetical protein